jgi:hypothetical protein
MIVRRTVYGRTTGSAPVRSALTVADEILWAERLRAMSRPGGARAGPAPAPPGRAAARVDPRRHAGRARAVPARPRRRGERARSRARAREELPSRGNYAAKINAGAARPASRWSSSAPTT